MQPQLPVRSPRSDFGEFKQKVRKFVDAVADLPRSPRFSLHQPESLESYDAIVIGSDEVWNFRHPWYGGKPIFFGSGLQAERLISYAASFGNHDVTEGIHPHWAEQLRRFAALSVRDDNSRLLVKSATDREAELVLDPCLLFPQPAQPKALQGSEPYALVYGHSFPAWLEEPARAWSRRTGIPLVSVGYRIQWANEQRISAGPSEFARLMAEARAVITNFFHGCVFALLNGKPFIAVPSAYRLNKVRDLASALGAEQRIIDESTPDTVTAMLLEEKPEAAIGERIDDHRRRSNAFLDEALR